ncbi:hypothetical protein DFH09DRAFT_925404 [Mycena vulgaris]|nr:hypothetical protein DFH09DRAFT_942057 [Mycena vulgaris]KAJ6540170.1 hypothetical protein DFH09DRAFT_929767 [Mycena vulgaris]KAJ6552119.1 hypothetical protein DFH09DRAFT_925404 [Mycena vulgaris]
MKIKGHAAPLRSLLRKGPPTPASTSAIELTAEDLYGKEKVDLETVVIDDVFKLPRCTEDGLAQDEAERRLGLFGPNKLEQEDQNLFLQASPFTTFMWNPLSWVMEAAAFVVIPLSNGEGQAPDWQDLIGIVLLCSSKA